MKFKKMKQGLLQRNYKYLLLSNSVLAFALGIYVPFWIIFIQNFGGGIESFGFAIGLMALSQAVTSYFVGKYSDRLGRKKFLLTAGFAGAAVTIAYTLITTTTQMYILQIIEGAVQAISITSETAMLGDFTKKVSRGTDIGKYQAITGILAAIAMMGSGLIVGKLGIKIIFYIVAAFFLISTIIIWRIKENKPQRVKIKSSLSV